MLSIMDSVELDLDRYELKDLLNLFKCDSHNIEVIKENYQNKIQLVELIKDNTDKKDLRNFFLQAYNKILDLVNDQKREENKILMVKKETELPPFLDLMPKNRNINHPMPPKNLHEVDQTNIKPYISSLINPVYRQVQKQNLHFDSRFRKGYYQSSSTNFQLNLSEPCESIIGLKLSSICIPNSWYLFADNRNNNTFIIEVKCNHTSLAKYPICIKEGNYTRSELVKYLNDTWFYNSSTDTLLQYIKFDICKFSLKSSFQLVDCPDKSYSINIRFASKKSENIIYNAGWILGFRYAEYMNASKPIYSEGLFDCSGDKYFYFCLNDYNKNVNNENVVFFEDSTMRYDVLSKIYLIDGKFSVNIDENTDDLNNQTRTRKYHGPITLKKMEIKIVDAFGRTINLNNMDFSFVLEIEKLYRKI